MSRPARVAVGRPGQTFRPHTAAPGHPSCYPIVMKVRAQTNEQPAIAHEWRLRMKREKAANGIAALVDLDLVAGYRLLRRRIQPAKQAPMPASKTAPGAGIASTITPPVCSKPE